MDARSAQALTALLDALGAYVFAKDREGRFTYANAPMLAFLGLSWAQLEGRHAGDLVDLGRSPDIGVHDRRVLDHGESVEGEESNWMLGRQRRHVFWTVKRPLRDAGGQITGLVGVSTDITERKRLESELAEQRQLLRAVLDNLDAYIYMKDEDRRYRFINQKVAQSLGISAEWAVGRRDVEIMPAERAEGFWRLDRQVFASGQPHSAEETFVGDDGQVHHHWSIKVPVHYEGVPALIGFSTDISELVQLREQLRHQAVTDGLTGLCNRRHFFEQAEKELARARRHRHATALLLLDIDHFKRINDRFGHPMGDRVLQRVGQRLRQQLRTEDTLARVGGEEFAVLLPRATLASALALGERLRVDLAAQRDVLPAGEAVTVSIGVAFCEDGGTRLEPLYADADARLYRAKAAGRNRVAGPAAD